MKIIMEMESKYKSWYYNENFLLNIFNVFGYHLCILNAIVYSSFPQMQKKIRSLLFART